MAGGDDGAVVLVVEGGAAEVDQSHVTALHPAQVMLLKPMSR